MFTGLVADLGRTTAARATAEGLRLTFATRLAAELSEGDSVCVDGVCLTATAVSAEGFSSDVMRETLERSTLGALAAGGDGGGDARVNLELAVRAADRLGGHIVQGHVDGVGTVVAAREDGFARVLTIRPDDPGLLRYVVAKGSICAGGVSLTVARIDEDGFDVSLIPETLRRTSLGAAGPGTRVNLEVDVVAKYVEKLLAGRSRGARGDDGAAGDGGRAAAAGP